MTYEQLRRVFAKIGITLPVPNDAGWSHCACVFAPFRHRNGVDRSRGFAVKAEDNGISAHKCPACGAHGRISGMIRVLGILRKQDYDAIAKEADDYDMMGSKLPSFDDQFTDVEIAPEPLDEEAFAGLFEQVADHNEAKRFVLSRHLTRATIEKLKIEYDAEKRRIVFPVRDGQGRLFGWSGRTVIPNHEPRILDYAGLPKRNLILGEHRWRPGYKKLLVEGLIGYARMIEIGAEEIVDVGALLGSSLTPEKEAILKRHGCTVLPLVDPDEAGDKCLFGQWREAQYDPHTGEEISVAGFKGGGLIDVLSSEVPVAMPLFPVGVGDVDDITFEQLQVMVDNAVLQSPNQEWLDNKSRLR